MTSLDEARDALRVRLGRGARYDDPTAPARELAWARLGTACFARKLNELSDADLSDESEGLGYERRRIVAEASYEARAFAQYVEWSRLRVSAPSSDPFASIEDDVILAVTLPAGALRHLFAHSEIHLNVEWRDLDGPGWDTSYVLPGGRKMSIRDTALIRSRKIWLSAFDLRNGCTFDDFPPELIDAFLTDAVDSWKHFDSYRLRATDRTWAIVLGDTARATPVTGTAANLARWISGRGINKLIGEI